MRLQVALCVLAFLWFSAFVSPAHFWFDSGEISAAGAEFGVMHPTGVPGYQVVLHLSCLVPLGSLGFRMGLVSAAFAGFAIAIAARILQDCQARTTVIVLTCLWMASSLTLVRNARVVEIYTFGLWLTLVVIWGFLPVRPVPASRRVLGFVAAVVCVWGYGDARLTLVVPAVVVWLVGLHRGRPWAPWVPAYVALASLVVLTLPLASVRMPLADWGDPDGVLRWWQHLQASSIRAAYVDDMLPSHWVVWERNMTGAFQRMVEDLGWPAVAGAVVASAAGLLVVKDRLASGRTGMRLSDHHWWRLFLAWLAVGQLFYVVAINPMGGVDRQTGMILVVVLQLSAALVIGHALSAWESRGVGSAMRRRWLVLGCVVLALSCIAPVTGRAWADRRATSSWLPSSWTRSALSELAPSTLLVTQSDDLAAGCIYARVVEGARPDVRCVVGQHLYRRAPDRTRLDPRLSRAWDAAAGEHGEVARARAFVAAWGVPVALEYPGTAVFRGFSLSGARSRLALQISSARDSNVIPDTMDSFLELLEPDAAVLDRRRIAHAMAARARWHFERGDLVEAQTWFRAVLERVDAGHVSSLISLGAIEDRMGRPDRAIALMAMALEREPHRYAAVENLAKLLERRGRQLERTFELSQRASGLRPRAKSPRERIIRLCARPEFSGEAACGG